MTFDEVTSALRQHLQATVSDVVVLFDNGLYVSPGGETSDSPPDDQMWVRFTILPGESTQVTMGGSGNRRFREVGVAMVQVFAPIGKGLGAAEKLASTIQAAFRGKTIESGIICRTPSVTNEGRSGAWWQINVSCPYTSDQID